MNKLKFVVASLFFSFVFVIFNSLSTKTVLAGNYGEGNYGSGDYNVGVTPSPVSNTTNTNSAAAPICSSTQPTGNSPWIYSAVSNSSNEVTLQFVNYQTPITHFVIEYGTKSGEYKYSVDGISKDNTSYTIQKLTPATTYYFRIRTSNDCATGSWSNEIQIKTKGYLTFNNLDFTESELEPVVDDIDSDDESKKTTQTEDENLDGYEVNIKVINTNKEPVKGAKVTLHSTPRETTTDDDGIAHFSNVEQGDHKVLISYNNFQGEQSINLSGDTKEFNLNITVTEKKIMFSPVAYIIIGLLILIISVLVVKLQKKKNTKNLKF